MWIRRKALGKEMITSIIYKERRESDLNLSYKNFLKNGA